MAFDKVLVGILIPSGPTWDSGMGVSLAAATAFFMSTPVKMKVPQGFFIKNKRGSILPQLRQQLVQEALVHEPTHLLFIDSDQTFPADLINRLIAWNRPCVACNISTKGEHPNPTARNRPHPDNPLAPEIVYTTPTSPKLGEVWRIGCGIMMLKADVFEGMKKPWFYTTWKESVDDWQGEDWGFCERLEEKRIPIMIDHRLSLEVGHVGQKTFYHKDVMKALYDDEHKLASGPNGAEQHHRAALRA